MTTVVCWPSLRSSMGESWVGLTDSKQNASHRSSDQTVTGETGDHPDRVRRDPMSLLSSEDNQELSLLSVAPVAVTPLQRLVCPRPA